MDRMNTHGAMQGSWTESEAIRPRFRPAPAKKLPSGIERERRILTQAVELDVIPELLARYRAAPFARLLMTHRHVTQLTALVLEHDGPGALAFVTALYDQGADPESLLLDLLAPSARALGTMWEDDLCDFTQVTIGLWRLQSALRALAPAEPPPAAHAPRVVLVPLPGEPHTFGLDMVHAFFARAGWNAWTGPVESSAALRSLVADQSVAILGFSLACDERLDDVRREIASVRRASCNPAIAIMVGGPGFTANPSLAGAVGADATAYDARDAVTRATALLADRQKP